VHRRFCSKGINVCIPALCQQIEFVLLVVVRFSFCNNKTTKHTNNQKRCEDTTVILVRDKKEKILKIKKDLNLALHFYGFYPIFVDFLTTTGRYQQHR
jgi:hypothetical protein